MIRLAKSEGESPLNVLPIARVAAARIGVDGSSVDPQAALEPLEHAIIVEFLFEELIHGCPSRSTCTAFCQELGLGRAPINLVA